MRREGKLEGKPVTSCTNFKKRNIVAGITVTMSRETPHELSAPEVMNLDHK